MLAITEKELGHALFYAIKLQDYDHVEYLLTLDPPLATSYFIAQDNIAYTPSNAQITQILLLEKWQKSLKNMDSLIIKHNKFYAYYNFFCKQNVIGVATAPRKTLITAPSPKSSNIYP